MKCNNSTIICSLEKKCGKCNSMHMCDASMNLPPCVPKTQKQTYVAVTTDKLEECELMSFHQILHSVETFGFVVQMCNKYVLLRQQHCRLAGMILMLGMFQNS